jgi:glycosyltransferase involved in cell wall biosynthesis
VPKILFLTSNLDYSGASRLLTLLAPRLPRERFHPRVCVLQRPTPWGEQLRAAGVEVSFLGWARPIDLRPFLSLFAEVRDFAPDVLHVWGLEALRALSACGGRRKARLVVSAAVPAHRPPSLADRWLLRRADAVVAFGEAEAHRYEQAGVPRQRITVLPPAFDPELLANPGPSVSRWDGIPPEAPVLLAVGPILRHKGFREAVWATDLLGNLFPDLLLVLAGDGPDRGRIVRFARVFGTWKRVHFPGRVDDLAPLYRRAGVVWVPSLKSAGVCVALEGMAAGRPVVASRCPALEEVVVEGETGFLVEPGDAAALARKARLLLEDSDLRQRMGAQARRHVSAHYSVEQLVGGAGNLYEGLASAPR